MTENQILSREILCFLGSYPKTLLDQRHDFAGQLAVQLGNALLVCSAYLERGEPQVFQALNESPQSLFALGKQFREIGLKLWEKPINDPLQTILNRLDRISADIEKTRREVGI